MAYTVELDAITKSFGHRPVLRGVDLRMRSGNVLALLGANGAGKTTLVRILCTLLAPDGGGGRVAGHDLATKREDVRRSLSLTGQFAAVDDVLTGEENLVMMARLRRLGPAAATRRAADLLEEFDLVAARGQRVGTYSGGMKRRLDLAMSMIETPALLVLDEPTTGLDPRSRDQVWRTVTSLVRDGVTILLTTQYLEEADRLADRVAVLHDGLVASEGTPAELKSALGGESVVLELADAARLEPARRAFPGARVDPELALVEVPSDGSPVALAQILERCDRLGLGVRRVETRRPSLDDVFLALTHRPAA